MVFTVGQVPRAIDSKCERQRWIGWNEHEQTYPAQIAQTTRKTGDLMATQTAQTTQATPKMDMASTSGTPSSAFTAQVAAIFLMAAGWGWTAGNFVQPANTGWGAVADVIHVIPLVALLLCGLPFVASAATGKVSHGVRNGITALAAYGIIGCSVMITLGLVNRDPNSVGVHTFEDWMPVIVLNAGTLLWLVSLLPVRRRAQASR